MNKTPGAFVEYTSSRSDFANGRVDVRSRGLRKSLRPILRTALVTLALVAAAEFTSPPRAVAQKLLPDLQVLVEWSVPRVAVRGSLGAVAEGNEGNNMVQLTAP